MKIAAIASLAFLFGCTHEGPSKSERATVIQHSYVPSTTSSGTGFSSKGSLVFTSSTSPEVWATVFRCADHGATFALTGKETYESTRDGQTVDLEYVEVLDGREKVVDYRTKRVMPLRETKP